MTCDRSAFEDLFVAGNTRTVRFLLSKGCSAEQAEELSQRAWSRAWEKRHLFDGRCPLVNWVISIALNLLRGEFRRPRPEFVEESALNGVGRRPQHDAKILVGQILALVDPHTRQVLTDCYLTETVPVAGNSVLFRAVRKARRAGRRVKLIAAARAAGMGAQ